jgi:hypothetical protein
MSTSGSIDVGFTARQCITFALRKLRVIGEGEDPTADQADDAAIELNLLLKEWMKHENLWRMTEGSVTLAASDYDYTLSPHPHRVISARYRDANSRDLPMTLMSREEYYNLPLKSSNGIPTQYYVDYQRSSAVMYVWQGLASVTTETIQYTFQRKFEDIDNLSNDIDIRQEHFSTVAYNLATRLIPDYAVPASTASLIVALAENTLEAALDEDREDFIQLMPEYS